ncbi:hypothetical protein SUGI_0237030 [Cryptomeria japonica]|nr:hypothetical protein SUGI_0237030 [Cryptomeria japonica]
MSTPADLPFVDVPTAREVGQNEPACIFNYYGFALLCLAAVLLFLPLILPALPPPPFVLLLVPVSILLVLIILAFRPFNVADMVASSD